MNELFENENDLAHSVIGMAIDIHKTLGPGLDEAIYLNCLKWELESQGIPYEINCSRDIEYKGLHIPNGYKIDLLINNLLVVELETCENILEVHIQKVLKSLRLGNHRLGLVINFNTALLKNGIRRVSNNKNQEID